MITDTEMESHSWTADEIFCELIEPIASFLDLSSVGRLLRVCSKLCGIPSKQRLWKKVCEVNFLHKTLPAPSVSTPFFDYAAYLREKLIWGTYQFEWEKVSPTCFPSRRSHAGVTRFGDKLVVVGGHYRSNDFMREDDVWLYHCEKQEFEKIEVAVPPPKISRFSVHTFGETIYSFGGILQDKSKLDQVYTFRFDQKEWQPITTKGISPSPRCESLTQPYTWRGKQGILVFSGSQEGLVYQSDVHFFNIDDHTWEPVVIKGEGPEDRIGATGCIIGDKLFIYGGGTLDRTAKQYRTYFRDFWCLHLGEGEWRWSKLSDDGPAGGLPVSLTSVPIGNHILVEGFVNTDTSYVFDTVSCTWLEVLAHTRNPSNYGAATVVGSDVYYTTGYRGNAHAKDVLKLSLSPVMEFIRIGTVPPNLSSIPEVMMPDVSIDEKQQQ